MTIRPRSPSGPGGSSGPRHRTPVCRLHCTALAPGVEARIRRAIHLHEAQPVDHGVDGGIGPREALQEEVTAGQRLKARMCWAVKSLRTRRIADLPCNPPALSESPPVGCAPRTSPSCSRADDPISVAAALPQAIGSVSPFSAQAGRVWWCAAARMPMLSW